MLFFFYGFSQNLFKTTKEFADAATLDLEIAEEEAALKAKKDRRDAIYKSGEAKRVKTGKGIAGHKNFGDDSELYGSCGFVRKSERKSTLIRGTKDEDAPKA